MIIIPFVSFAVIHEPNGPTPHSHFEHSSVPATVKKIFNLKADFLTRRDAWAGTFESYLHIRDTPQTDCPGLCYCFSACKLWTNILQVVYFSNVL